MNCDLHLECPEVTICNMEITPIAYIKSPYKQKFAIPRQPGLVKAAVGEIIFEADYADVNCLRKLDEFSHLWLLFRFHETVEKGWTPTVQPPRLGGKEKVGVFATRSTFRPNGIGLSVVENLGWQQQGRQLLLRVGSIDLLDQTPILDIKPYIPYADSIPEARAGYAEEAPANIDKVEFCDNAERQLVDFETKYPRLRELIISVLVQDPRPAWRHKTPDEKQYGMSLYELNIKWRHNNEIIQVVEINQQKDLNKD